MTAPQTVADVLPLDVLYNEGSDSVVLADPVSHDDVAEVFHNERHTVTQTVEQALVIAQRFAASELLLEALAPFADVGEFIKAETTGFDATDDLYLINEEGHLLMRLPVSAFLAAVAALRAAATSARQGETK